MSVIFPVLYADVSSSSPKESFRRVCVAVNASETVEGAPTYTRSPDHHDPFLKTGI
jgi:hypothetical protein